MRNKFSDLIKDGVAEFKYINHLPELPEQDPICREYNNLFSIPSDTHMSMLDNGLRVIKGHMINTPQWDRFICASTWGGIKFGNYINKDYWSASCYFSNMGLCGSKDTLNGEVVYILKPHECEDSDCDCPTCCVTSESNIPQLLSICGDMMKIQECYKTSKNLQEVAQKLNESSYIKGNKWYNYNDKIYGLINNKVYIL